MNNSHNFMLKYDGAALADSTMDVAQLAPALLSLSEALSDLNQIANADNAKVALQVRALNKGCFIVDLQLAQDFFNQVGSLLTGTGVAAYCNAYTLVSSLVEIFLLKKWLDGRKPDQIITSEDQKEVTFCIKTEKYKVSFWAYRGYRSSSINSACSKIADPLHQTGIDSLSFSDTKQIHTFTKDDLPALDATAEDEVLTTNTAKCVVTIETAAFKDKNSKWRVRMGEHNSVFATITDKEFMAKVEEGTERFGKGDVLYVDMNTTQTLSNGNVNVQYTIVKVFEHKNSPEQLTMF